MKCSSGKKTLFKILTCALGAGVSLVFLLFILGGGFMKQTYLEPWNRDYASHMADPRVRLAAAGLLAANNHNMQPWKVKLDQEDPMVFYLYADGSRATKEVDPLYRQLMITQGTFLEYVKVAGEKEGFHTDITIFPEGDYEEDSILQSMDQKPVARILLSPGNMEESPLYPEMFLADTNRGNYKKEAPDPSQISVLLNLSDENGLSMKFYTDHDNLKKIGKYVMEGAEIEAGVTRVMDESNAIFRANEKEKNQYRFGYSLEGQGVSGLKKCMLQGIITLFPTLNEGKGASENFIRYTKTAVTHTPSYAMILSRDNSRTDQVRSGMLYSRLVLTGHTLDLTMQPLSQVLEEYPEMKQTYENFNHEYASRGQTVQMLLRIGKPVKPAPYSMRRDVLSLIKE
ncbi:hypothetical protein [Lacrimispora sp.]|uniref:Acg family FMN-binding oxidoreductase n=1 Tax=Lacrimispora sp. TaxID=2719234 RepID=UPI0029E327EB|nr:hypothetical protein [Lacrimispora sp.]